VSLPWWPENSGIVSAEAMARTYRRDARGRFAGGGGGSGRPATKGFSKGAKNRLTRDNAGKITGQGGSGATARGGRLKTASGNARARQVGKLKGGPKGTIGKPKGLKPGAVKGKAKTAPKTYGRGVDAAKVERMIGRLRTDPKRSGGFKRVNAVKAANSKDTRTRALDYMNKAGGLKVKKKGGSPENPSNLSRDQLISNIAAKIPKSTKRSTARNRSNDVKNRQETRARVRSSLNATVRSSNLYGRTPTSSALPFTPGRLSRIPDSPGRANGLGGNYRYAKVRQRTSNDPFTGPNVFAGGSLIAKNVTVRNNASIRTRGQAAQAQSARRAGVRKLRGTGQLGKPTTTITRGKARQPTLSGGTATTYGRFRVAPRRSR